MTSSSTSSRQERIDLHTHSSISDGTDSPHGLILQARRQKIDVIALTDHDTDSGWRQARAAAQRHGVTFVPGMELSTRNAQGISFHFLSYLHNPECSALRKKLQEQRDIRLYRARTIVEKLSHDYPLSWEDVLSTAGATNNVGKSCLGRPHIADALATQGVVSGREEAFNTLLSSNSSYYVPLKVFTPEEGIALILDAGGVPVLAHGLAKKRGRGPTESDFKKWVDCGLAGLEIKHREHTKQDRLTLSEVARRYNLIVTGSSDFHGAGKPNLLGENLTLAEELSRIEALGTGSTVFRPQ